MNIYDFNVKDINDNNVNLGTYKGKVLLIVNTASRCGLTPQYKELQTLYKEFGNENFEVLAFPCNQFGLQEPGTNQEIIEFCSLNYSVNFPVFAKIDVNGDDAHPLFKYLRENSNGEDIKWNFTKFIIDKQGNLTSRIEPRTTPFEIKPVLVNLINT